MARELKRNAESAWWIIILFASGAFAQTSINAGDVTALAGSTAAVPIRILLPAQTQCATLQFNLTVVPNSGVPTVIQQVTFASSVGPPSLNTSSGLARVLVAWLSNFKPPLSGTMQVGILSVPIPASAQAGNTYTVQVINPSGMTDDLTDLPMSGVNGVITIALTPTKTPTPTQTPTPTPPCVGDCTTNGKVTVDELLTMVNIALGNADVSDCFAGDANHDHQITIDEILGAVSNALNGC